MPNARIHAGADARSKTGCTGLDNTEEPLKCAFSTTSEIKLGTGTTTKKQISKLLWYIKQQDINEFGVRKISPQFVPVGEPEIIDEETLLRDYTPEVELHNSQIAPAMQALKKTIAKGDKYRAQGNPLSAEMEYTKALEVDETNVRAIFGLGLVYLNREDMEKSQSVFGQLVTMEAAFSPRHKHLFNEFGISLRKAKLYDEAVEYYARAVELCEEDENLYYNLSRAHYENNDWENCLEYAACALKINPDHSPARSICRFTLKLAGDDSLRMEHGKPPVSTVALKRAEILVGVEEDLIDTMVEISPDGIMNLDEQ